MTRGVDGLIAGTLGVDEQAADFSFHSLSCFSAGVRVFPAQGLQQNPGGGLGVVAKMVPSKGML